MQAGRSFGDVLDNALGLVPPCPPLPMAGIGTSGLFAAPFAPRWRGGFAVPPFGPQAPVAAPPVAEPPPTPEPLLRPRSEAEHAAWRTLRATGAGLPSSFTASDLKRAFRRVARRLHPDGHPTLGADARARLCRDFAEARDAYLTLVAITNRRI